VFPPLRHEMWDDDVQKVGNSQSSGVNDKSRTESNGSPSRSSSTFDAMLQLASNKLQQAANNSSSLGKQISIAVSVIVTYHTYL